MTTKKNKKEKKDIKVRDLKPKKDAKGGGHVIQSTATGSSLGSATGSATGSSLTTIK